MSLAVRRAAVSRHLTLGQRPALLAGAPRVSHPSQLLSRSSVYFPATWKGFTTMSDAAAVAGAPADGAQTATQALSGGGAQLQQDFLVQYVVVRKDLWTSLGWPLGSVVAQACHASSAAIWTYREDDETQKYLSPDNIDHMRKVVLEVKDEAALRKLGDALTAAGVKHKMWVEQPENFPTCLATRPYSKAEIGQHFKKYQLSKAPIG